MFGSTHETKRSAMQVILNRRFDVPRVGVDFCVEEAKSEGEAYRKSFPP